MSSKFIHLHTHSHYSLLDGLSKVEQIVSIAKKSNMDSIAITDHGNMYGAIEFYKECQKKGIKPIIGCEVYVAERKMEDREPGIDNKRYHLILLAKNLQGYKNLMRIVSEANLKGYYYKPRVDMELLKEFHEGIIALSGCMGGKLSRAVLSGNDEKVEQLIQDHIEVFGKENYFIEIQSHPKIENDKKLRDALVVLAKKHGLTYVATQDSHYPCHDDHEAHHTLLQVNTGSDGTTGKFEFSDDDFSIINEKKALEYFSDYPEAVTNTQIVNDMCEIYDLELGKAYFPDFPIESGKTADEELRQLAFNGFAFRNLEQNEIYLQRLEYELGIIKQKGYPTYFLVVGDLLRFSRENKILTNIRGSVAGSLTTYLLGITNVDPIEYKLPFERFLNPERPSLPDIDMDFADNRRDDVIAYTKSKYGEDRVAQIGTFGTMMAKGSVKDVARALGYPYSIGDRISGLIPLGSQGMPMTIEHALEIVPELADAYKKEPDTKKIIDLARKMEGCVRHISVHAAGIVIAPRPLYEFSPIQYDPKSDNKSGNIITQYDMYSIEDAGLPKFDFLGIRNLAILANAVDIVKQRQNIDIDIENVSVTDEKTFALLARGETSGLFQLNGSGMTHYLKELKPTTIYDINVMVALYRPGPMENIDEYIARKHGKKQVRFIHPKMKDFLDTTFGVLVYQDDLLMTAIEVAGYSWGEVDKFRKAIGKKIPEEMAKQHVMFVQGCQSHGKMTEAKAEALWKLFEPFQGYGFNKAHAASYGRVAYQTAYMKANYPVEYMTAIMTAESGDIEKVAEIVHECEKMGITVLPPSINESFGDFTVINDNTIRFGLYTIKNLGTDIADSIIEERKSKGNFKDLENFFERINHKNLNKKSVEALTKSGAMDEFGDRNMIIGNLEKLIAFNKESRNVAVQDSLFGGMSISANKLTLEKQPEATQTEKLSWEKELLGLYISGHPLDAYKEKIEKFGTVIKKVYDEKVVNEPITVACLIEDIRVVTTKKNDQMAFLKLSDYTGTIDAVVFTKLYASHKEFLVKDTIIALQGKVTERNGEKSIMIEKFKKLE